VAALAKERTTRVILGDLPDVRLPASRRAAMRAELLAASDAAPAVAASRGPRSVGVIVAAALAAAAVAIVIARRAAPPRSASAPVAVASGSAVPRGESASPPRGESASAPVAAVTASGSAGSGSERVAGPGSRVAPTDPRAPAEVAAASDARGFDRNGDVVRVDDGAVVLDARGRQPAQLVAGASRVAVADSRVQVTVRHGQLVQVQVFAGTVEVTVAGRVHSVTVGDVWEPPPPPPPPATLPSRISRVPQMPGVSPAVPRIATAATWDAPASSAPGNATAPASAPADAPTHLPRPTPALDAFRIGWQALRAGHYADAINAFDRATAPAVAEDACYWAAVAAARAGDQPAAQRRLRAFLEAYPTSPHAAEARAALRP